MAARTATLPLTTLKWLSLRNTTKMEYKRRTRMNGQAMATAKGTRRSGPGSRLQLDMERAKMDVKTPKATM